VLSGLYQWLLHFVLVLYSIGVINVAHPSADSFQA